MAISYNAADYIEKDKIINACEKIDEIAKSYYNMGKKMQDAASEFTKDVLSVDGETLTDGINTLAESVRDCERQVNQFTEELRSKVTTAFNQLQTKLDEEKKKAEEIAKQENNTNWKE